VRTCYQHNKAAVRVESGAMTLEIQGSVFCDVREPLAAPLCAFYEALTARVLQAYGLECAVRATDCLATGSTVCRLSIGPAPAGVPARNTNDREVVR
jgi:predicted hydrocarbon binding protein